MPEFSHVSYTYERAVIPTGVILAILADLSQPLLTLRLISAVFIDLTAYRNLRIARNNIADVLARPREEGSFDAVPMKGGATIDLSHVDFFYGRGPRVLSDFSLHVPEGRLTALVGGSGCGKFTVLSLIAQLYRPDRGTIAFSGVDTAGYAPESVLRNVALVDQDVFLFDDSVTNNVRYARPGAGDKKVREACRLANTDDLVRALPQGDRQLAVLAPDRGHDGAHPARHPRGGRHRAHRRRGCRRAGHARGAARARRQVLAHVGRLAAPALRSRSVKWTVELSPHFLTTPAARRI